VHKQLVVIFCFIFLLFSCFQEKTEARIYIEEGLDLTQKLISLYEEDKIGSRLLQIEKLKSMDERYRLLKEIEKEQALKEIEYEKTVELIKAAYTEAYKSCIETKQEEAASRLLMVIEIWGNDEMPIISNNNLGKYGLLVKKRIETEKILKEIGWY
jgi:hypothetical protein